MDTLPKLSFCMTDQEMKAIEQLRQRLGHEGVLRNRSEIIRAAIMHLYQLSNDDLISAAEKAVQLKPGRKRIQKI